MFLKALDSRGTNLQIWTLLCQDTPFSLSLYNTHTHTSKLPSSVDFSFYFKGFSLADIVAINNSAI